MRIVSAEIENYKSFLKSDEIHFAPGFNVIVGQNNVGKTALVEAIALRSGDKPHRSPKTIQSTGRRPSQASLIKVSFELTNDELAEMFWNLQLLHVPVVDRHQSVESNADQFSSAISDKNVIRVTWRSGELFEADFVPYAGRSGRGTVECIRFTIEQSGTKPELVRPIFKRRLQTNVPI